MDGIEKRIDKLGRVVIPIEYRKRLGAQEGTSVFVRMENDCVVITSAFVKCALCGAALKTAWKFKLCGECISKIKEME